MGKQDTKMLNSMMTKKFGHMNQPITIHPMVYNPWDSDTPNMSTFPLTLPPRLIVFIFSVTLE